MSLIKLINVITFIFLFCSPAQAILGEQVKALSIEQKAKFSVSSDPNDRREIKEFFDKSGNVFGTCYDPRIAKDLNPILGTKYSALFAKSIKESTAPNQKGHPRFQSIKNNSLVIKSIRVGRTFKLCVYDPNKLPEGMSGNEVQ